MKRFVKRTRDVTYVSDPKGVRELGVSDAMGKAAGHAAEKVISAARSLDPDGEYVGKPVGVYSGRAREPRNAVVVEGRWWPGARVAALKRAVAEVAKGFRG